MFYRFCATARDVTYYQNWFRIWSIAPKLLSSPLESGVQVSLLKWHSDRKLSGVDSVIFPSGTHLSRIEPCNLRKLEPSSFGKKLVRKTIWTASGCVIQASRFELVCFDKIWFPSSGATQPWRSKIIPRGDLAGWVPGDKNKTLSKTMVLYKVTGNGQFLYENHVSAIFGEKYTSHKYRVNRATNSHVPEMSKNGIISVFFPGRE